MKIALGDLKHIANKLQQQGEGKWGGMTAQKGLLE